MTRHHAAIILTVAIIGALSVGVWYDHRAPSEATWFELLLAALQVAETA